MRKKIKRLLCIPHKLLLLVFVLPVVAVVRLIRPWLLVRWGVLPSPRIGHFAANTELYLCERAAGINLPRQSYIDIFFMEPQICNEQLAKMWKRVLRICPVWWLVPPLQRANRLIPGGAVHEIGDNTQSDRDVHNLFDRFPSHLQFTSEEEKKGEAGLRAMGISPGVPFVCLIVRDSAYLDAHQPKDWSYHNYRDSDIRNYVLAAEALADRGYFVIRMGAKVCESLPSKHPRVIDYAKNGQRSDFMDVYLGAKCVFCISTGTGFDAVPKIFRRPIVYVNMVPVGYLQTFREHSIGIVKQHFSLQLGRNLTLTEIFKQGLNLALQTSEYEQAKIKLVENTSEEICDAVIELEQRQRGTWSEAQGDAHLQGKFRDIYQKNTIDPKTGKRIHGDIRIIYGTHFLRLHPEFLT